MQRMLPTLTDVDRPFWTSGVDGTLRIQRCAPCGRWIHPPVSVCPTCGGVLRFEAVSGLGTVFTFTVNEHPYRPEVEVPYVIAIVQLDEQEDLRLPTNIVGCDPADVACGMRVLVQFEPQDDVWVPVFAPAIALA